eukprot:m.52548 g.52548  ORF g.52548 m.52548 type:complete len:1071 (+) comp15421_c0_seq4:651-3863(+)
MPPRARRNRLGVTFKVHAHPDTVRKDSKTDHSHFAATGDEDISRLENEEDDSRWVSENNAGSTPVRRRVRQGSQNSDKQRRKTYTLSHDVPSLQVRQALPPLDATYNVSKYIDHDDKQSDSSDAATTHSSLVDSVDTSGLNPQLELVPSYSSSPSSKGLVGASEGQHFAKADTSKTSQQVTQKELEKHDLSSGSASVDGEANRRRSVVELVDRAEMYVVQPEAAACPCTVSKACTIKRKHIHCLWPKCKHLVKELDFKSMERHLANAHSVSTDGQPLVVPDKANTTSANRVTIPKPHPRARKPMKRPLPKRILGTQGARKKDAVPIRRTRSKQTQKASAARHLQQHPADASTEEPKLPKRGGTRTTSRADTTQARGAGKRSSASNAANAIIPGSTTFRDGLGQDAAVPITPTAPQTTAVASTECPPDDAESLVSRQRHRRNGDRGATALLSGLVRDGGGHGGSGGNGRRHSVRPEMDKTTTPSNTSVGVAVPDAQGTPEISRRRHRRGRHVRKAPPSPGRKSPGASDQEAPGRTRQRRRSTVRRRRHGRQHARLLPGGRVRVSIRGAQVGTATGRSQGDAGGVVTTWDVLLSQHPAPVFEEAYLRASDRDDAHVHGKPTTPPPAPVRLSPRYRIADVATVVRWLEACGTTGVGANVPSVFPREPPAADRADASLDSAAKRLGMATSVNSGARVCVFGGWRGMPARGRGDSTTCGTWGSVLVCPLQLQGPSTWEALVTPTIPPMLQSRQRHACCVGMLDGNPTVFASGGEGTVPAPQYQTSAADAPAARDTPAVDAVGTVLNTIECLPLPHSGALYGGGGDVGGTAPLMTWQRMRGTPTLPTPTHSHQVHVFGHYLYAVGGVSDKGSFHGRVWRLELSGARGGAWARLASLPRPCSGFASAVLHGHIFVVGGWDGSRHLRRVQCYNIRRNQWVTTPPMPTRRYAHACVATQGLLYAIGGGAVPEPTDGGGSDHRCVEYPYGGSIVATTAVEVYSPGDDAWRRLPGLHTARMACACVATPDGRVWVMGGQNTHKEPLSSVEVYDPVAGVWVPGPTMPVPLTAAPACVLPSTC